VGNFLICILIGLYCMSRKIIFIIVGALLFLALLALLWFWFLHRSPAADTGSQGSFATTTDRTGGSSAAQGGGNTPGSTTGQGQGSDYAVTQAPDGYLITSDIQGALPPGTYQIRKGGTIMGTYEISSTGLGKYALAGGNLPSGTYTFVPLTLGNTGIGAAINAGGGINTASSTIDTGPQGSTTPPTGTATTTVPGGTQSGAWIGSAASERIFSPSDIASLTNTSGIGGTPLISTTPQAANLSTSGLVLAATAAACVAQWVANQLVGLVSSADPGTVAAAVTSVPVLDLKAATQRNSQNVIQCIVKSIAQAAIDQITRSVVGWINSGFNGQPSFVTNFNQYFANVADQAAGEFIKSSALSFLCSPFAPQIKIAIAQSYANRNNNSNTCSLSKVTSNINSFLNGNWSSGGWGGLLQLTTVPTNNPYGAYAYAQIGLNSSIASAQNNANRNISPGGFISIQKCDTSLAPGPNQNGTAGVPQNCKTTTPGQVIQDSLNQSLGSSIGQLQVAQNINDIINALINQLVLKTLYGGLANANNGVTNPLAPAVDQAASAQAKAMLATLQTSGTYAVQYGSTKQGSASDIEQVQNNFNTVFNCWQTAASSTALSSAQQAQAAQNAAAADTQIAQLQTRVDAYNTDIERANASLVTIQNLQSQVMFATTPQDVSAAQNAVQAATPSLIGAADVTTAQQDRASLQTQLTATNSQAQTSLAQCRAFGA
jgi:hypothetical protein